MEEKIENKTTKNQKLITKNQKLITTNQKTEPNNYIPKTTQPINSTPFLCVQLKVIRTTVVRIIEKELIYKSNFIALPIRA